MVSLRESLDKINLEIQQLIVDFDTKDDFKEKIFIKNNKRIQLNFLKLYNEIITNNIPEKIILDKLKLFLNENWGFIKGTAVSYTVIPNSPVTKIMCDLAEIVSDYINNLNGNETMSPIQILMPSICLESIDKRFPNLSTAKLKAIDIVRTHITSKTGNMLMPVRMILNYGRSNDLSNRFKPYYDVFDENETSVLDDDEIYRIENHSTLSMNFIEVLEEYNKVKRGSLNLFYRLEHLCDKFYINSVEQQGQEEIAGESIYGELTKFETYYRKLLNENKNIPSEIINEISKIFEIASKKTEGYQSCVSIIRSNLLYIINRQGIREQLSEIKLNEGKENDFIRDLESSLKYHQDQLENELLNPTEFIDGSDKTKITYELSRSLCVAFEINTEEEFVYVINLKKDSFFNAIQEEYIQSALLNTFNSSSLGWFIEMISEDNLKTFLQVVGEEKLNNTDVINIYDILTINQENINKLKLAIQYKKEHKGLIELFFRTLENSNQEDGYYLIDSFKNDFKYLIINNRCFTEFLKHSNDEQSQYLIDFYKNKYISISTDDFVAIFRNNLSQIKEDYFFDAYKDNLKNIIKNGREFSELINLTSRREDIYNQFKGNFKNIVTNVEDFINVRRYLGQDERNEVFEEIKLNVNNFLQTIGDFERFINYLNDSQAQDVFNELKGKTIDSYYSFTSYYYSLHETREEIFINVFKENLFDLFNTTEQLVYFLNYHNHIRNSNKNKLNHFILAYHDNFISIIKSFSDMKVILECLNDTQRSIVFNIFKDNINNLSKDHNQTKFLFRYLNEEQMKIVINSCPDIFNNVHEFSEVYCALFWSEWKKNFFNACKGHFKRIIKHDDYFWYSFYELSNHQKKEYTKELSKDYGLEPYVLKVSNDVSEYNKIMVELFNKESMTAIGFIWEKIKIYTTENIINPFLDMFNCFIENLYNYLFLPFQMKENTELEKSLVKMLKMT